MAANHPRIVSSTATIGMPKCSWCERVIRSTSRVRRSLGGILRILTWLVSSRITGLPRPTRLDDRPHGRLRFQRASAA